MTGQPRNPRIAVIGAGMSGICMAAQLQRAGIASYTVFEKADRIGGTWRDNTYPGLTCDVPSRFYQFTFAPNPEWTHLFPSGSEIWSYFDSVARQYGVFEHIRFGCTVTAAEFVDTAWQIRTSDGMLETYDFVIAATGILHHPVYPRIDGLDRFAGAMFHSARWDHTVPIAGRRVGVIGTGSTGAQIVCSLAGNAREVTILQRTAQWTLPLGNRPISAPVRWLHRHIPPLNLLSYLFWRSAFEFFTPALTAPGLRRRAVQWLSRRQLNKVADPLLRQQLTPDYEPGCRRLVVTRTFYDIVQRPDTRLVTDPIAHVEPAGIRLASGELVEIDVLVLATGFDAHAYFRPMNVVGRDGLDIADAWADGPRGYQTVAIHGFPNFFTMMGPNSPVGNYALTAIAESQSGYVMRWIDRWRSGEISTVEPRREAADRFNLEVNAAMPKTIWASGCSSWYLGQNGQPELFPWTPDRHRSMLRRIDRADYRIHAPGDSAQAMTS
jgi:cation diffusion facilitator CzcD-associated flavoprotein CzcO